MKHEFKVGDLVKDVGGDKDGREFIVQRVIPANPLTAMLATAMGRADVADDPVLMNDDLRFGLPAGLAELVQSGSDEEEIH